MAGKRDNEMPFRPAAKRRPGVPFGQARDKRGDRAVGGGRTEARRT